LRHSDGKAEHLLDQVLQVAESIAALPHRGTRPRELPPGLQAEFRQAFFKPYRVIYEIRLEMIVVHLVADGRRDLRSLLMRRLFPG
jgi:toxin ParE1/3/4